MKIYIAGPMRGYPQSNFPAFDEAELAWQAAGHVPVSPATLDRVFDGFDGATEWPAEHVDDLKRRVMRRDLLAISECEAMALLPGWEDSRGARVELLLAWFLDLPVYCSVSMERLPWRMILWDVGMSMLREARKVATPRTASASESPPST